MNFLAQKFVLSIIICIFTATESAKPLNDAQMCGSFFKAVTAPFQACFVELWFYFCSVTTQHPYRKLLVNKA